MPLPSRAVSRLAPLSKHAAVIADADIPHIESVEWSGHDLRQQLVTRGVRLTSLDTKLPSSIHCRLYIIPAIGPWPLLPPTWTVLRANNITAYCNLADVQAYVLRTLRIALPYNYFLPLPHRCISATMELHRPETKEMTEARRYLCSVGGGADSAEGQYEWLVKGDPLLSTRLISPEASLHAKRDGFDPRKRIQGRTLLVHAEKGAAWSTLRVQGMGVMVEKDKRKDGRRSMQER
ncbi:uncharacterized protein MKK02DRAFT_41736 [Dioszegia hungarica]|uniref:Uncharacterized protein n=1 Tax=Dioszegia hungarica TaxID=4972 RepID=A0AA38LY95_9TREE|nr:uncharacterized protein MKK02DRAFT_41736 [Dioszegia hungarica]KAI9638714.1 hypothetical protein MKK02DRAFT_41736 [Dioszegia hungarica]